MHIVVNVPNLYNHASTRMPICRFERPHAKKWDLRWPKSATTLSDRLEPMSSILKLDCNQLDSQALFQPFFKLDLQPAWFTSSITSSSIGKLDSSHNQLDMQA